MRYITLLMVLLFFSCKGDAQRKSIIYKDLKKELDSNLISHFPSFLGDNDVYYNDVNLNINNISFQIYSSNISSIKIDSIESKVKQQSKKSYSENDSCLFIVNKFLNEDNYLSDYKITKSDKSIQCNKEYLPVPNFWNFKIYQGNNKSKFSEDFHIYVLDAKPGIYWTKNALKPSESMPNGWENGYSKGVAISKEKRIIIYWLIIW